MKELKRNVGRPKKSDRNKKNQKIFINMTLEQKKRLQKKAEEEELSLSQICLRALKAQGII